MRSKSSALALLGLSVVLLGAARPAAAVDETAAAVDETAAAADHPERGMRMSAVEARYGAPASRQPAVGQPPITRWDYPGFVVYFENDRVLHAVVVTPAG